MPDPATAFAELVEIMRRLRAPGGCPWDREQDHETIKKYLIEETYEVIEAIDARDDAKLKEELGDLLLQIVFHAEMAEENKRFDVADVCQTVSEKLIRRHPHVFGDTAVENADEVLKNWEQIKRAEPGYEDRQSALDGIPKGLPALLWALDVSKKAARQGFEWAELEHVFDKLHEEIAELQEAVRLQEHEQVQAELGDILFTAVNVARWCKVDPEDALRQMVRRFSTRFRAMEAEAEGLGVELKSLSPERWEELWQKAKAGE